MEDLGDSQRAWSCHASEACAVIMWIRNRLVPYSDNILFSLSTAKTNAISAPGAKQENWSVPRSIDATTTSTCRWHFSYAEYGKLIIEVGIRIFPNFPVTSVEKYVKFYHMDSSLIVESIIFAVSRQGPKIAFPARVLKKIYSLTTTFLSSFKLLVILLHRCLKDGGY